MPRPRIVFMGTPDFAVASLRALVESGQNVVGVVTTPDRPVGRHHGKLQPCPVAAYAGAHGIPLLQPERLRDPAFLSALHGLRADMQVVVAFRMLPEEVWAMPPMGTFNLHASLLPAYRGAAPINWAIIRGEELTGCTTFLLDRQIDTGAILLQQSTPIRPDDNAASLHDRLMAMGARLVLQTVHILAQGAPRGPSRGASQGAPQAIPQSQLPAPKPGSESAPKLHRENTRINWAQTTLQVHNFIRGLAPRPAAWTLWRGTPTKILASCPLPAAEEPSPKGSLAGETRKAHPDTHLDALPDAPPDTRPDAPPDTAPVIVHNGQLLARCSDGWLSITRLQPAGSKPMDADAWLRGHRMVNDE